MVRHVGTAICLLLTPAAAFAQAPRGYVGAALGSSTFSATSVEKGSPSTTYTNNTEPGRLTGAPTSRSASSDI